MIGLAFSNDNSSHVHNDKDGGEGGYKSHLCDSKSLVGCYKWYCTTGSFVTFFFKLTSFLALEGEVEETTEQAIKAAQFEARKKKITGDARQKFITSLVNKEVESMKRSYLEFYNCLSPRNNV